MMAIDIVGHGGDDKLPNRPDLSFLAHPVFCNGVWNTPGISSVLSCPCSRLRLAFTQAYDVLCTLDQEVSTHLQEYALSITTYTQVAYVWLSPRSLGKCLYFINRYISKP